MKFGMLFIILAVLCMFCLIYSARGRRGNIGYFLLAFLTALCDVACFFLIEAPDVETAHSAMTAYYLCQTWLYLVLAVAIGLFCKYKELEDLAKSSGVLCIVQTLLIAVVFFGVHIIEISRRVFLGSEWWVVRDLRSKSSLFSLRFYNILCFFNSLIIIYILIMCYREAARLFRSGYLVMIVYQSFISIFRLVLFRNQMPLWMDCVGANMVCFAGFYIVNFYMTDRIRFWGFRNFTNDMGDGVVLYDEHGVLIHMNDVIKRKMPEELVESFHDKERLIEWMEDTVKVERQHVQVSRRGNKETYYKVRSIDLAVKDRIYATMYILHDTTESIQEMKAMALANKELERAGKMKSDFLANMSHEIRTPMNAVIGMAEIALREDLPENVRDYLNQIQNSGKSLLNIINDILDLSKIESGKMEIISEEYEPLSEINDIANILMTRVGDKPLELFFITEGYIPRVLEGDAMRIRQIIINLANNAIKFTSEGMVQIHVKGEKVKRDEVMLHYHIIDTGQGIKEEDLGKLFVSFQQVDSKRNRSVEGTGLGLAISRKLCEAMKGKMGVTSEYGKGSDFYFSIPQKIVDDGQDLVVEDAEHKHAVCINGRPDMIKMFMEEMDRLGISGEVISSVKEYVPSGKTDFIFFEHDIYESEMRAFLDENPKVTGVTLVNFESDFIPEQDNLRVMRRPETSLDMVMILNDREIVHALKEDSKSFVIDFIAPEAKFLIVDDNMINITIAEGLLAPLKAQILSADGGRKAIELVKDNEFDIIFMDHMMPEIDGIETTHIIRKNLIKARTTPIIALTANAMEGAKDMFLKEGMNDLVTKPIDIRALISCVKQWLPPEKIVEIDPDAVEESPGDAKADTGSDIIYYEGLDVDKAIASIGMPALYNKIVEEYYRSGSGKYQDIKNAYDTGDWKDYTIKVHALKSSSRQIGAAELGDLAESLEKAGKADDLDYIHGNTEGLLNDYQALLDKLSQYFPEEEVPDVSELPLLSADDLGILLDRLAQACDDLDMDEMENVRDELKGHALPGGAGEFAPALYEAIDNLDTETCAETIAAMRGAL